MFILGGLALSIGAFLIYVALKPADYLISRQLEIKASPEALFPWINNSRKTNQWMPWAALDPAMKMSFNGPEEGVGAESRWESSGKMGVGSAVVVESVPPRTVKTRLDYWKPFRMTQEAEMAIVPAKDGSVVTWSVRGKNNFVGRLMCVFVNMDKMVGGSFETGLANLKALAEKK